MNIKGMILVFTSLIFLSGCDGKHSKEWFINHHQELIEKYTECLFDNTWSDDTCQNARNAARHEMDKPDIKKGISSAHKKLKDKINSTPQKGSDIK